MRDSRIYQLWLKQYLKNNRSTDFYEVRSPQVHILINKRDFNIRGAHTSVGEFDADNDIKSVYEYIERIMCLDLPEKVINEKGKRECSFKETMLSLNELGFTWTENKFVAREEAYYVEAVGIKERKRYMIPAAFVYYLSDEYKKWEGFGGNSNGTALGDNFKQAYEAALFEFVERDKFIKYWFLDDGKIWRINEEILQPGLMYRVKYFKKIGYDVDFYYLDNQPKEIVTVWCLMRSNSEKNVMFSFSGLGTGLNLKDASDKSFEEASGIFFSRKNDDKLARKIFEYEEKEYCSSLDEGLYFYFSYKRKKEFETLLRDISILNAEPKETDKSLDEIVLGTYDDILYSEIENRLLKDLGFYGVKVFGLGGHSLYFSYNREVMKRGKINGPCPFA